MQFRFAFCICLGCSLSMLAPAEENRALVDAAEKKDWQLVQRLLKDPTTNVNQTQADRMTALHWAAYWSDANAVRILLGTSIPRDEANLYGVTPLALACENGNAEIVRLLVKAGANIHYELPGKQTLLMTAARGGKADTVAILVEAGADVLGTDRSGQTPLMWAAAAGSAEVVRLLIRHGADPNAATKIGFTANLFACREGNWPVVQALLESGVDVNATISPDKNYERAPRKGMSGLMLAIESAHYELAIRLVDAGADPNDQRSGLTPLHSLCWVRRAKVGDNPEGDPPPRGSGNLTALRFAREIVKRGADVNRSLERGDGGRAQMKPRGSTPFLYASRTADLPLMKTLLELGADPNIGNEDDCKPIQAAAGVGVTAVGEEPGTVVEVIDVLQYLIGLGADVNSVDKNRETAMHGAAYRNYPEVVSFLAKQGADPKVWNNKNKYGWTPTMIAQGKRPGSFKPSPETIAALENAMK
ncbi:MAG: ankyrin repeat domain-containing protein [Pirellula sp.]